MATLTQWLWLSTRRGLPAAGITHLLNYFGTPEAIYSAEPAQYAQAGLSKNHQALLSDKSTAEAEHILEVCSRLGVRILTLQDAGYPERLRQIPDPPCVLYLRGKRFAVDESVTIGVVGTRKPTPYGVEMAGTLGLELARSGVVLVSGIAQGLDAAALKGALKGGGSVISVLGCGVDVVYPSGHRWLYEDVAATGALVSEFPPGSPPEGWHFPIRNRIISGLSLGVVAVEAGAHSGTLITARLALEQNRDVFAFPGPANAPMSYGTNRLIQRGEAKLICSAKDVLSEYEAIYPDKLNLRPPLSRETRQARLSQRPSASPPAPRKQEKTVDNPAQRPYITLKACGETFTEDEQAVLLALGARTLHPDELTLETGLTAQQVLSALTLLQVKGFVSEEAGRRFAATTIVMAEPPTGGATK